MFGLNTTLKNLCMQSNTYLHGGHWKYLKGTVLEFSGSRSGPLAKFRDTLKTGNTGRDDSRQPPDLSLNCLDHNDMYLKTSSKALNSSTIEQISYRQSCRILISSRADTRLNKANKVAYSRKNI